MKTSHGGTLSKTGHYVSGWLFVTKAPPTVILFVPDYCRKFGEYPPIGPHDTQPNDIQHNDNRHNVTQPNDTQHKNKHVSLSTTLCLMSLLLSVEIRSLYRVSLC